jgi:hypothetical protein
MFENEAQSALDEALSTGAATYEISTRRRALILTVKEGNPLIPIMDRWFGFADLDLVPKVHRHTGNAVPVLNIDKYAVAPKIERRESQGRYMYELMYSERS